MGLTILLIALCAAFQKNKAGGRSPAPTKSPSPEAALKQQIQGSDRKAYKRGSGRCPQKNAESETTIAFCKGQNEPLVEPSRSLAEKIDKQTEIIMEAELARGRYQDKLAEVYLKLLV